MRPARLGALLWSAGRILGRVDFSDARGSPASCGVSPEPLKAPRFPFFRVWFRLARSRPRSCRLRVWVVSLRLRFFPPRRSRPVSPAMPGGPQASQSGGFRRAPSLPAPPHARDENPKLDAARVRAHCLAAGLLRAGLRRRSHSRRALLPCDFRVRPPRAEPAPNPRERPSRPVGLHAYKRPIIACARPVGPAAASRFPAGPDGFSASKLRPVRESPSARPTPPRRLASVPGATSSPCARRAGARRCGARRAWRRCASCGCAPSRARCSAPRRCAWGSSRPR